MPSWRCFTGRERQETGCSELRRKQWMKTKKQLDSGGGDMIIYPLLEAEACPPLTWIACAVGFNGALSHAGTEDAI